MQNLNCFRNRLALIQFASGRMILLKISIYMGLMLMIECTSATKIKGNNISNDQTLQKHTGGITGVVKLKRPWESDTAFIYLRYPITIGFDSSELFYSKIDTIYPPYSRFFIDDLIPGPYAIIVTNNACKLKGKSERIQHYTSFTGMSINFGIVIKPDTLSVIMDTLFSPGRMIGRLRDDIFARVQDLRIFNSKNDRIIFKTINNNNKEP